MTGSQLERSRAQMERGRRADDAELCRRNLAADQQDILPRMMLYGSVSFTAGRAGFAPAPGVVVNVLTVHVPYAARYVTGGCKGGDAFIGRWLYDNRPGAEHVIIVPADRSQVDEWWLQAGGTNITVIHMPQGTTRADRNARLVTEGDCMFGFPTRTEASSPRSGTWQACRMARRAGKLSQWHCVTPPYQGQIEVPAHRLLAAATGRLT
jgi:hypothetical protein